MKRFTTTLAGPAVFLAALLWGVVAAQPIDTISFDADRLTIDAVNRIIRIQGCDIINQENHPDVPVSNVFYHAEGAFPEIAFSCRLVAADTIILPFSPAVAAADLPTASGEAAIPRQPLLTEYNNIYPNNSCLVHAGIDGGRTVWTVTVLPVQYLAEGRIVYYRKIEIAVENVPQGVRIVPGWPGSEETIPSRPMASAAASHSGGCPLGSDYVIVTSSALAESFEPLVELKRRTGFSPVVADIDSILAAYGGRDVAEVLRNYLIDFYLAGGRFVLLGGDESVVPIRYAYYYNTDSTVDNAHLMISDLYFADCGGEWDYDNDGIWGEPTEDHPDAAPELAVGRLPFSRAEQVTAWIGKLERYLFNPGSGDLAYLNRAAFFTSDQMRDYGETGQQTLVAANFPDSFATDCITLAESPSGNDPNPSAPSTAGAENGLSDGYGLVNVLAHGRPDGFVLTSSAYNENPKTYILTGDGNVVHAGFRNLARNDKTGFYYTIACDQAAYDLEMLYGMNVPSVAEELLSLDSAGAIGVVAFTRWGWVSSSYKLMASFYRHLFGDAAGYPVQAMVASWQDYPYYRDQIYGQNYFGDPSLRLYTDLPAQVAIAAPETYDPRYPVTCTVMIDGAPLCEIPVSAEVNDTLVLMVLTDDNGVATFTFPEGNETDVRITAGVPGAVAAEVEMTLSISADADDGDTPLPTRFDLEQNFPNPFNPATTIRFSLARLGEVSLEIFNILGQPVAAPVEGTLPAGEHDVIWDGRNRNGEPVASGIYIYRLRADDETMTRTMALIK
jgi:hypothetical protein